MMISLHTVNNYREKERQKQYGKSVLSNLWDENRRVAKGDLQPDIQTLQRCEFHLGKRQSGRGLLCSVQLLPDENKVYP